MEFDVIYRNGIYNQNDDLYFLRFFQEYDNKSNPLIYEYITTGDELKKVKEQIPEQIVSKASSEFDLQCRLMLWVSHTLIGGQESPPHPFNSLHIFEQTQKHGRTSNCWVYAIVLNEVFLSFGFRSRMVRCMPLDLRLDDCHCMTLVYSKQYLKWIALDAAMGTYYTDQNKVPLSLREMRHRLIADEPILTPYIPRRSSKALRWYLCKNMIRFQSYQKSCFNMEELEEDRVMYTLNPLQYIIEDKKISNGQHWIWMRNIYNADDFWGSD